MRSSRGGFDIEKILKFLKEKDISQLYIIGGDGTHRGAYAIHEACIENNLNVAVAGKKPYHHKRAAAKAFR